MQTNPEADFTRLQKQITPSLENFSDETKHKPGVLTALYDIPLKNSYVKFIIGAFYGNGNEEANKGYVSIVFNCQVPIIFKRQHDLTFSCVVAIKDNTGRNQFVRTFTFPYDSPSQKAGNDLLAVYSIDRYISRETIFDNRNYLLSDDTLNLEIDISLQMISPNDNSTEIESAIDSSLKIEEDSGSPVIVLPLNSEIAKRLHKESTVFRATCDNPMLESSTGLFRFPANEEVDLKNAIRIIMGAKKITFNSFDDIGRLYIFADKYDIQKVIRECRKFCDNILHVQNSWGSFDLLKERKDKILGLASLFNDEELREIVERFLKNNPEEEEIRKKCEHRKVNLGNVTCTYTGESPYLYFQLQEEKDGDKSDFEFYN